MKFTERTPIEQGFTPIFEKEVRPALMALEDNRLELLSKARFLAIVALGSAITTAAIVLGIFRASTGSIIGAVVIMVLGLIGMGVVRAMQTSKWKGSVANAVMPAVCKHIGALTYDPHAQNGFPVEDMRHLGMIGSYDNANLTDRLDGTYRDTEFELVEARLTKKTRDSDGDTKTTTVFNGLLFRISVPVVVPTPILIAKDYGAIGNKLGALFSGSKGRGMPVVKLPHERFEAAFEVYAEDPQAALQFLPPVFLDNLLAIGESEGGKAGASAMRAGFSGKSFYLSLGRKGDFLAMGSLSTPVADMEEDLHEIFDDIEMLHRIIDRLHGG